MFPRIDKGPIEYFLKVERAFNTEQKRECIRFRFQTIEEFHHFRYIISTDSKVKGNKIGIRLRGLKTQGLFLPAVGRAEGMIDFFDLKGEYDITIAKPGNVKTAFKLGVTPATVSLVDGSQGSGSFLHITMD
jgi:hypothetical protein